MSISAGSSLMRTPAASSARTSGGSAIGKTVAPGCSARSHATVLTTVFAPGRALGGVLPTPGSTADLLGVLGSGFSEIREQVTPAIALDGLVALTAALFARFVSRQDESPAMKMVAAMRNQFGGHAVKSESATLDEF